MSGRCFAVVGPSGAGKDTLIAAARAAMPGLHVVRRAITRTAAADGGEDHEALSAEAFAARTRAGGFVLIWRAHGLDYGIPASLCDVLAAGRDALFNGSRAHLAQAAAALPGLRVIHVTAPAALCAARLARRGREAGAARAARLARDVAPFPPGLPVSVVENGDDLAAATAAFLAVLQPERG